MQPWKNTQSERAGEACSYFSTCFHNKRTTAVPSGPLLLTMATMAATKQHLGNACWGDRQRQQKRKRPLALALALPLGSGQRKGGKPVSVSAYCVAQGSTLARRAGLSAETKKQLQRVPPRGSRRVSVRQDDARKRRRPRGVEAHGFAELAAYVSTQALNGPPYMYFLYLIAAGCGVPVSEDALVCWIGACLALKQFTLHKDVVVLALTYLGVVLSDMITFYIGVMMERGVLNRFFPNFAESESAKKAKQKVQQWGQKVGFMQRFCIGFRAPLCLMSGLVGVKPKNFFYGTCKPKRERERTRDRDRGTEM